jgi:2-polyprenyl-3-methyl-5-hydroxy-6-metoxy-1,4-benzoquinol methylase
MARIRETMSMRMPPVPARGFDFSRTLASQGWFHSAELPDGTLIEGHNSLASLRERYARFPLPSDLAGRRVLDVGAWDGWFSFEAERRGAKVTAIDCVEIENFLYLRRAFTSNVDYRVLDLFEVPGQSLENSTTSFSSVSCITSNIPFGLSKSCAA